MSGAGDALGLFRGAFMSDLFEWNANPFYDVDGTLSSVRRTVRSHRDPSTGELRDPLADRPEPPSVCLTG